MRRIQIKLFKITENSAEIRGLKAICSLGEWGSQEDNDISDIDESGFDGFDRIDEIISTQDEEIGKGLLASLLAISADESSENDDDGENDITVLSDEKGGSSEEDADDADKEQ